MGQAGAEVHCVMNGYQLEMRIIDTNCPSKKNKPSPFDS